MDTIFQRLYVLNSFRALFKEKPNIGATFGAKQCIIGGVVLAKLAKLCYESNLQRKREAIIMASELFTATYKLVLQHPQHQTEFSSYRMREFMSKFNLFEDVQIVHPS